MKWTMGRVENEIHIVPTKDLVEHFDKDCICGATTQPIKRTDGSMGWMVTHHSLDGREKNE